MDLFNRLKTVVRAEVKDYRRRSLRESLQEHYIGEVDGIPVSDVLKKELDFLKAVRKSMTLIQELDPRRHRRICRQLKHIVNVPLVSAGLYGHDLRMCVVDADKIFFRTYENNIRMLACILIHEATHGVLEDKLILYTKEKRERIEGLCHKEEFRFAKRLEPGWAERYVGPFRPELWKLAWDGTLYQRLAALITRWSHEI